MDNTADADERLCQVACETENKISPQLQWKQVQNFQLAGSQEFLIRLQRFVRWRQVQTACNGR